MNFINEHLTSNATMSNTQVRCIKYKIFLIILDQQYDKIGVFHFILIVDISRKLLSN